MDVERIIKKIAYEIKNKYNTNLIKIENNDTIIFPFVDIMSIEVYPIKVYPSGRKEFFVYFIYGDEEDSISSEDFTTIDDLITEVIKTIDLYWNKKIKIITEKKPWHFYKQTRYYLDSENNWQLYDEFDSKFLLVLKKIIKEEILDFSIKK
ncbi:MAG: hypothetical protein HFH45_04475 [Bacilli bacterium]|nr:hypothetical protein [Bacilli bacterium]